MRVTIVAGTSDAAIVRRSQASAIHIPFRFVPGEQKCHGKYRPRNYADVTAQV